METGRAPIGIRALRIEPPFGTSPQRAVNSVRPRIRRSPPGNGSRAHGSRRTLTLGSITSLVPFVGPATTIVVALMFGLRELTLVAALVILAKELLLPALRQFADEDSHVAPPQQPAAG